MCEHVEILYDIDIVYRDLAQSLNLRLERTEMLNTAPAMMDGLADLVTGRAKASSWL